MTEAAHFLFLYVLTLVPSIQMQRRREGNEMEDV